MGNDPLSEPVPPDRIERTKLFLSGVTEEYKTLRDESKQASINMLALLQIGAGFLGALMVAAGTQWSQRTGFAPVILLVIVPSMGAISMLMWLGEARRFKRVGDYLCLVEAKYALALKSEAISSALAQEWRSIQHNMERDLRLREGSARIDPLAWERWLRSARSKAGIVECLKVIVRPDRDPTGALLTSGHDILLYAVRLAFFPLLMFISISLGVLNTLVVRTRAFGPYGSAFLVVLGLVIFALSIRLAWQVAKDLIRPVEFSA